MHLSEMVQARKVKDSIPSGMSPIDSDLVDMAGFEGCLFLVTPESIDVGGIQSLRVLQGAVDALADAVDVKEGYLDIPDHAGQQAFWIDINRPRERYLRLRIIRSLQNSAWGPIWALQYGRGVQVSNEIPGVISGKSL